MQKKSVLYYNIAHGCASWYDIYMFPQRLKIQVRELRSQGKTYPEIRNFLNKNIPKSTLSGWCSAVKLPTSYAQKIKTLNKLHLDNARSKAIGLKKEKREVFFRKLSRKNQGLVQFFRKNKETQKIVLAILYLAEGSKTARGALMFGNSDPFIIMLFLALVRGCYEIDESKFRVTVQCRADQNIVLLEGFWSKITRIPRNQFYKARVDRRTIGQKSRKPAYKGVCRIDYFSSFVDLELKHIAKMMLKVNK